VSDNSKTYVLAGRLRAARFEQRMAEGYRAMRETSSNPTEEGPLYAPAYDQTDGRMLDTSEFPLTYINEVVMWDRSLKLFAYVLTSFGLAYVDENDWLIQLPNWDVGLMSDVNFQILFHEEDPDDEPTS
jgi:hypothetical protein